jgi:hypothetical protein
MIAGFIALAATYFVGWAEPDNTALRYPVVAALGLIAILGVAVAGVVDKSKNTALTSCLVISGYMCAASAAFLSIPRQPGMWHVATTGAVVLVYGAVAAAVSKSAATVHAAAIVIALVPTVVLVINAFYLSPPAVIAAQVGTLALLAVLASRLPLGLASVESVINQKPQNELAHRYQTGILFGASLLMVVSAFISGFTVDNTKWGVFVFWVGVAVSVMNRSRNYVDRTAHIILLTASGLIMFGYISSLMLSHPYGNSEQILAAVLVTVFIALIGSLWAIGQKKLFSPTRRFHFEIVERIFYAVPVIVLGIWLMEAYTKVRNR